MAVSGTITQVKDNYGLLFIQITGFAGLNNTTPPFLSQGYPYGSIHLVGTTTTGDTVQLQGSNDGVNYVLLASFAAAATNAILPLTVGSAVDAPAKFYQLQLTGTGGGTYTFNAVLMGTRG